MTFWLPQVEAALAEVGKYKKARILELSLGRGFLPSSRRPVVINRGIP